MGELRSLDEIKAGDTRAAQTGVGRQQLPASIGIAPTAAASKALPNTLNESPGGNTATSNSGKKCWSSFMQRPGMSAWANKNKAQAASLKQKYEDC
jgi:hypothetical protein